MLSAQSKFLAIGCHRQFIINGANGAPRMCQMNHRIGHLLAVAFLAFVGGLRLVVATEVMR